MSNQVVTVYNSAIGEESPSQECDFGFIKKDKPVRFYADMEAGDKLVVEGRTHEAGGWIPLHVFEESSAEDVYLSRFWRISREEGNGTSSVTVQNVYALNVEEHV